MKWWQRLLRRKKLDEELERELSFHLEQHTSDLIEQGYSPVEARRRAHIALGGPTLGRRLVVEPARLGQGADALLRLEDDRRLLLAEHAAERLAQQMDGCRQVHGPVLLRHTIPTVPAPDLLADLLRRASELLPVLRERAARVEQLRRLPPETVKDLVSSGLVRIGTPRRYGGNGLDIDAGHALQQLHRHVRRGSDPGRAISELAGLTLGERDELPGGLGGNRRMNDKRLRQLDVDAGEVRAVIVRPALVGPAAPAVQDADQVDHGVAAGGQALQDPHGEDVGLHHVDGGQEDEVLRALAPALLRAKWPLV